MDYNKLKNMLPEVEKYKGKLGNKEELLNYYNFTKEQDIKKQTGLDFKTYTQKSDIDDVQKARLKNKINLYTML